MKNFKIIFAYELRQQFQKKTVRVTTLLLVIVSLLITSIPRLITLFSGGDAPKADTTLTQDVGYVFSSPDQQAQFSGLLALKEESIFASREALTAALKDKLIKVGFVLAPDLAYEAIYQDKGVQDNQSLAFAQLITHIEKARLLEEIGLSQEALAGIESYQPRETLTLLGKSSENNMLVATVLMVCIYMLVLFYGQSISTMIAREKDSKAMELLITSTSPTSLIMGKVAAGGLSGIIQFGMIVGGALLGIMINKAYYPPELMAMLSGAVNKSYILSFIFFSLSGYLLYLFLYAALGSTVSRVEDVGSAVGSISFLFIGAYMASTFAIQMPASAVSVVTSLIPFTSIMVMPARAGVMSVPVLELLTSGLLMLLAIALFAWLSVKIYRWGTLNYGNKTSLRRIFKEALRKEAR